MVLNSKEFAASVEESAALRPIATAVIPEKTVLQTQTEPVLEKWKAVKPGQPALTPPIQSELQDVMPHPEAGFLGDGSLSHSQEMEVIESIFEIYIEAFGEVPTGESNAHIMNALRGNNSQYLGFFPFEHPRLDGEGRLVDPWNTPYFFHLLSRTDIEIRSAGPDLEMYTDDDEIK
jgi:hypothetical protein